MELKSKNFLLGTVVGAALLFVAIVGILTYFYFKGSAIKTEQLAKQQKLEAEQTQRFSNTCSNAIPDAMLYLHDALTPTLKSYQQGNFDKEALTIVTSKVNNKKEFLSHCATNMSFKDHSSLKRSSQLMSASHEFANVYVYLNSIAINNCDNECQQHLVHRSIEATVKLKNILLGNDEG